MYKPLCSLLCVQQLILCIDLTRITHTLHCNRVTFTLSKPNAAEPATTQVTAQFTNTGAVPMDSFVFQAAVPKYLTMR
jgi:Adaptin C-terminal domain